MTDSMVLLTPPAFWMPDHFTDSAWIEHAPFAFWVIETHRPRVLVELGTHHGFSYLAFCQAVERLETGTRCYAIDHWKGDVHAGFYGDEVLDRLREYHDPRYRAFSELIRSSFDEAARHFPDGSVDLLHIDGTHLRESVQNDVDTWLPKMSERGVMLFHDINVHHDDFGVFSVWEGLKVRYPHFEFDHGHGLGVLGVGEGTADTLGHLFAVSRDPAAATALRHTFARLGAGVADHRTALAASGMLTEVSHLRGDVEQLARSLGEERVRLDHEAKRAEQAEALTADLETALQSGQADRDHWQAQASIAEGQYRRLADRVADLEGSTSWKATAPFRAITRRLVGVKRFARRAGRVLWWTMTLQLPQRLRARRVPRTATTVGTVFDEARRFSQPGADFEEFDPPTLGVVRARAIALYLPQFHTIPENDAWWGTGFTEWRNLARGVPRFTGHYQPRIPRDLGFYDLTDPQTLRRQSDLAKAAGIAAFCFYYYSFDSGRLLERPLEQLLADPTIDMPFCVMWANENWTRTWDGFDDDVLAAQSYDPGLEADLVPDLARHFADPRYLRVDGRPLFLVYRPGIIPDVGGALQRWRTRFRLEFGEDPLILMAQGFGDLDPGTHGFDGAIEFPPHALADGLPRLNESLEVLDPAFSGEVRSYVDLVRAARGLPAPPYPLIRTVSPSWDNEARRPGRGFTLAGSSPAAYREWLDDAIDFAVRNPFHGESFLFINAWNEWGEAAYLEPDVHFGSAYLNATARALRSPGEPDTQRGILLVGHDARRHGAQLLLLHLGRLFATQFGLRVEFLLLEGGELLAEYEAVGRVTVVERTGLPLADHARVARARGMDMAVTNTVVTGAAVPLLKNAGMQVMSLVHELPGIIEERHWESEAAALAAATDHIVFPARLVRDRFIELFPDADERAEVRPYGVFQPLMPLESMTEARTRIRAEHGWDEATRVVIGVGFGDRRKGLDRFVATATASSRGHADTRFVWVGDVEGGFDAWFTPSPESARHLMHVPFSDTPLRPSDAVPAVADWYAAADVLFVSSREDPFPSTVLEAVSAGLPVVAIRGCTGSEDLIAEHGLVVESADPETLLAALRGFSPIALKERLQRTRVMRTSLSQTHRFDDYGFALLQMLDPHLQRVSVVVPNFNYARYLPDRLRSIFAQTHPVFEVIFLDDASTDDSIEVVADEARAAKRAVTIRSRPGNSGSIIGQWREGVEAAHGEFVWIAEADDSAAPEFLAALLDRVGPETVIAVSDSQVIDVDGKTIDPSYYFYYATMPGGELFQQECDLPGTEFLACAMATANLILNVSAVVMRRSDLAAVLKAQAPALSAYTFAGDWHVYTHLLLRGRVSVIAQPLNRHRRHVGSKTLSTDAVTHIQEIERVHREIGRVIHLDDMALRRQMNYRQSVLDDLLMDSRGADRSGSVTPP